MIYSEHEISAIIKSLQSADSLCQLIIHTNIERKLRYNNSIPQRNNDEAFKCYFTL